MTTTTNRINYQVGDVPRMGNCGVVAVANATGLPYQGVWRELKRIGRKPGNWKGSTRYYEVKKFLNNLADAGEIEVREYTDHGAKTVGQFVVRAPADRIFMVWTTGHVQVVHGGEVMDQNYRGQVAGYWGRRKFINRNYGAKAVLEIVRLNDAPTTIVEPTPEPVPATAPRPTTPTKRSPAIGRHLGIGEYIARLLIEGVLTTDLIVVAVRNTFPDSRATARDVSIIRCKLRRDPSIDFE